MHELNERTPEYVEMIQMMRKAGFDDEYIQKKLDEQIVIDKEREQVMTYEEVKRIRQNPTAEDVDNKELSRMIDAAIEKQIRKKPVLQDDGISYRCPVCNRDVGYVDILASETQLYCDCGQAIDWSDEQ